MDQSRNLEWNSQQLQSKFEELLESRNVYYNPPKSLEMNYDAIRFTRSNFNNLFANNSIYRQKIAYTVTVITTDPDAPIIYKVMNLPYCSFDRSYVADNLYHNVFTIFN